MISPAALLQLQMADRRFRDKFGIDAVVLEQTGQLIQAVMIFHHFLQAAHRKSPAFLRTSIPLDSLDTISGPRPNYANSGPSTKNRRIRA